MAITAVKLEREEYIEQAYFFRIFRERLAEDTAAQDILQSLHEEILSSTRLPMAIQYLATEMRHAGLLSTGFERLPHYFTAFQTFVVQGSERDEVRMTVPVSLMLLEREAAYKGESPTPAGLFAFQFEALCRNRLGYQHGIDAMSRDPHYDEDWRKFLRQLPAQLGVLEFADVIYVRSEQFLNDQRRLDPHYQVPVRPLFGEKEGKIAYASKGRDPIFFFAALQRQLKYPEVPRNVPIEQPEVKVETMNMKIRELETRIKLLEAEVKGTVDLAQFGKPSMATDD